VEAPPSRVTVRPEKVYTKLATVGVVHVVEPPAVLAARLVTAALADAPMLKLLPNPPQSAPNPVCMNGVRKVNFSLTETAIVSPIPLAPAAVEQSVSRFPDWSAQVADTVVAFSPTCACPPVSCVACVVMPGMFIGFIDPYAAPSRAALLSWI
jgi:hypothetical protein